MKATKGGIIGAIIGIPGSYFFQNDLVRSKCGGVGGYLKNLPEMLGDKHAGDFGIPQNLILGIIVFAAAGAFLAFVVTKIKAK